MKLLPAVCAAVFCASFISVRADDTPVQAAARAALEQKLNELDTTQTQAPPVLVTPSGAVVVQPDKSATNVTKTVPAKTVTSPTAPAATTSATNAVPAASGTTPAAPVAAEPKNPPAETMPTEVTPATPPPAETKPAPPAITPAAGTVLQSPVMPAMIKVKPGVMSATNQINAIYTGKELGLKPIESPLLPISAAQQAQLQALLAKYKANQITPEEYHNQRAEILAQP